MNLYGYVWNRPAEFVDPAGARANMIYFKPGTDKQTLLVGAWEAWVPAGAFLVAAHGNMHGVYNQNGKLIPVETLAERIMRHRDYRRGMPVYLGACNVGKGDADYADRLAKILGATVWAPTENVWYSEDGHLSVESADGRRKGVWKAFYGDGGGH